MTTLPGLEQWNPAQLTPSEIFWRDHYHFLKDRGYTLRMRYDPDWIPSWINASKEWLDCEDAIHIPVRNVHDYREVPFPDFPFVEQNYQVLDASRPDGSLVVLKRVDIRYRNEIRILNHLSSEPFASNPRNHCVPVLEVINPPEGSHTAFVVMPYLFKVDFPPFETIGEAIGFFKQVIEVVAVLFISVRHI
ncbi:hypothetical protein C0993_003767 [Termitomyces sp. T159_Od127]|nr:hypothetical protein C0993_003767 [Termitomyces sp. T159_Od127]